ncbi:hypothetical protein ACXR0O_20480 [Verrucomicrobiota bacterium sgz303538]
MTSKRRKKLRYALLAVGVIAAGVWLFVPESPEQRIANNTAYLERLAGMVCAFRKAHGHLPQSFEQAHEYSGERLPNRGDYYGKGYLYARIVDSAFFFRASNVELCYVDCHKVSRAEFVEHVRSSGETGADTDFILELYGFEST